MGVYAEQVLPRIVNAACGMKVTQPLRQRVCEGLGGDVVEIGFGSGHNVPYYPAAVSRVAAIEPADLGWKLARDRLTATSVLVERNGLDGQKLPLADDSFDAALTTWSLCTIPDPLAAVLGSIEALHASNNGAPERIVPALVPSQDRAQDGECHVCAPGPRCPFHMIEGSNDLDPLQFDDLDCAELGIDVTLEDLFIVVM